MPLHSWLPDCGAKAPVSVTAFLPASLDKLLGIYLLVRCVTDLFVPTPGLYLLLMALGAITIISAVLMALVQHDLKRLLSYHAVSQVGYMVLGIGTGTPVGMAGGLFAAYGTLAAFMASVDALIKEGLERGLPDETRVLYISPLKALGVDVQRNLRSPIAGVRAAAERVGARARLVEPWVPVDLVIDHSVMVDFFGTAGAFKKNVSMEYDRNGERYKFLKWGQGAKVIGGEIQVTSLDYAIFLKERGYVVDPDPTDPTVQAAFERRAITAFARHSRLGATDLDTVGQVRESFMQSVDYLRSIGFKRISLKTGSYGMEALAMAIRYSADAKLDLLTIDGSGGGTGMSPWNMMEHWGVPSLALHAKAYDYCKILDDQGIEVPDISFAGGFAREDHVFKALALGAPYTKLVCMGRAPMIPGYLGSNIEGTFYPERRSELNGNWDELPQTVKSFGKYPEEIFSAWEDVKQKVGADEMKKIPYGAVAMAGYVDKLSCGLQQLMAGVRKFNLSEITRAELFSANRETESETGIPFMTEAQSESAEEILKA